MRRKIVVILLAMTLLTTLPVSFANPEKTLLVSAWVDKTYYEQGDTGTLHITVLNQLNHAITIYNISITYESWHRFIKDRWEGNETITVDTSSKQDEAYSTDTTFTVPSDSRGVTTRVTIEVYTDERYEPYRPPTGEEPWVNVVGVPFYFALKDMDKLISLMMVQVVLIIVCTVILAAAIFLSRHRAPTVPKKEETKTALH